MSYHEPGVPPGYDTYTPGEPGTKRSLLPTKECKNCSEDVYLGRNQFVPPHEMNHFDGTWCSAECFLSYNRDGMAARRFKLLRAAINTLEKREVIPCPSRFLLERNGGDMPIEQYFQQVERIEVESGTKRVRFTDDTIIDEMQVEA